MSDSLLKKEFKSRDVNRARNLVNKDFSGKTIIGTGYQKAHTAYQEGDVWEENDKTWTIKDGLRQNVTKLDVAKKALRVPLTCPKCSGTMNYHLSQKMYGIHKMCFDCVIDYEAELRRAGLYKQYEKAMMQDSMRAFARDVEQWVLDSIGSVNTFVTENGDIEDWNTNTKQADNLLTKNLQEYLKHLRAHIDS